MAKVNEQTSGQKRAKLSHQKWAYFRPKKDKLRLPKDAEAMLRELEEILAEIGRVVAFVAKHGGLHPTKNCLPNNYARRLIYQVYRHCAEMNGLTKTAFVERMLEIKAKKDGPIGLRTASAAEKNSVFLCYSCAFSNELIGSTERSRASKLLKQARHHKVRERHLIGFLLQHVSKNAPDVLLVD